MKIVNSLFAVFHEFAITSIAFGKDVTMFYTLADNCTHINVNMSDATQN